MDQLSRALARLGLEASADAKAVRKAYARELKRIDQEADVAAFQSLREAYETAIGERQPVEETSVAPIPDDEAQEAYEWIVAAVSVISGGRRIADETIWVNDLIEQLAEQQPIGIDAGHRLEAAIGQLLVQGWKPGHEALLLAATVHFGWAESGYWPNRQVADAWFERFILHRQKATLLAPLVRVIRDLRQTHEPEIGCLRRDHGYLEYLAMHFTNLTPMIVDQRMLERWRELARPLGRAPDVAWGARPDEPGAPYKGDVGRKAFALIMVLLFISLRLINLLRHA